MSRRRIDRFRSGGGRGRPDAQASSPGVLVIVQNLPVPLDRRVWLECQALVEQGYRVTVICPRGPEEASVELLDGVHIYRYSPAPEAEGLMGFAAEFTYSWLRTAGLSLRVRRNHGFEVIQACNPPDTYWLLAAIWRLRGVRFVFDHHDLCPELYLSRFGQPDRLAGKVQLSALTWLERMTYRVADRAITTNASYRRVAVERTTVEPACVTIVRSGPDTAQMRPVYPAEATRAGVEHVLAYIGIMGPQDGVENLLLVMDELVNRRGRRGLRAVLMGFGDCLDALKRECTSLGLDEYVRFTGRVGPREVTEHLSAADLGLGPDLDTPLNNLSTMNKTMEYMAFGLPSVSFDLVETRVSVGDTGLLVPSGDISAFADAVEDLLDDDERRVRMGLAARARAVETLDWRAQAEAYVGVYHEFFGRAPNYERWPYRPHVAGRAFAHEVDLTDEPELRRFVMERSAPSRSDSCP